MRLGPGRTRLSLRLGHPPGEVEENIGHVVRLDYIFPADGRRVADDFPEYVIQLDPSPEAFFGSDSSV